jgi:hypothetical protein
MNSPRFSCVAAGVIATVVLASSFASAQLSAERVAATDKILQQLKTSVAKLSPRQRKMLDGYANIVHLADVWHAHGMRLADPSFVAYARLSRAAAAAHPMTALAPSGGVVRVSNPSTDIAYSSMGGFTQSETSTARCGNTVVVGFNDSGSIFETPFYFTGTGGQSFSGSAYSTNGGASFTDIGPVNPGSNTSNFLGGDPGINCADANTFFYSQIFDYYDSSLNPWAAIALNTSTDGGKSWGDPVPAAAKSAFYHLLDKPWSTVDPSNHKRIFVSYTDFDTTFSSAACGANYRTAIEFVESDDSGVTWSTTPTVAIEVCGNAGVQGSQMAVSSKGTMYISWVNLGVNFPFGPRAIQVASYSGGTLSAAMTVEPSVQPGGDSYYLQGEFRDFLDMAMAIDHSGTASDGTLYITWADGRDKIVPDPVAIQGAYAYDDVLLRSSTDGGKTWGFPVKVNSDIQSRLGSGHDHYQSGIAVDKRGYVGVCWYDRRSDSENFAIRRRCGESTNGFSFTDVDTGLATFPPTHSTDGFINSFYMGDYDQMTSDFLNSTSGFIGAFQTQEGVRGNPDAVAYSLH